MDKMLVKTIPVITADGKLQYIIALSDSQREIIVLHVNMIEG